MKITIYDYKNSITYVDVPDKEIVKIYVIVLTGDETVYIELADGSVLKFDSSNNRVVDFYDGAYVVMGKNNIEKWLTFKPSGAHTASYERLGLFL